MHEPDQMETIFFSGKFMGKIMEIIYFNYKISCNFEVNITMTSVYFRLKKTRCKPVTNLKNSEK